MFSAKYFRDNNKGITDVFKARVYTQKATIPSMTWLNLDVPEAPSDLSVRAPIVLIYEIIAKLLRTILSDQIAIGNKRTHTAFN